MNKYKCYYCSSYLINDPVSIDMFYCSKCSEIKKPQIWHVLWKKPHSIIEIHNEINFAYLYLQDLDMWLEMDYINNKTIIEVNKEQNVTISNCTLDYMSYSLKDLISKVQTMMLLI